MSHRRSKRAAEQLYNQDLELRRLQAEGKTIVSDKGRKKSEARAEGERSWIEKITLRGGFKRKRGKKWGDYCAYSECPKWLDEVCEYPERESKGCYVNNPALKNGACKVD